MKKAAAQNSQIGKYEWENWNYYNWHKMKILIFIILIINCGFASEEPQMSLQIEHESMEDNFEAYRFTFKGAVGEVKYSVSGLPDGTSFQ